MSGASTIVSGDALAEVAVRIGANTAAISDQLTAELVNSIDVLRDDEFVHQRLRASAEANISTFVHLLRHPMDLAAVDPPLGAVQFAHWLAQRGVPLSALLRAYYLAGARMSTICMAELVHVVDTPADLPSGLEQINILVHGYVDHVCQQMIDVFYAERERWITQQGAVRLDRVRALLAGGEVDIADTEAVLRYTLRAEHLGIIAWHIAGSPSGNELLVFQRLIEGFADSLRCVGVPLIVPRDDATIWAWLPLPHNVIHDPIATIREAVRAAGLPIRLAVGASAEGLDGFVRTHRLALAAESVALAAGDYAEDLTPYEEVATVSFLCHDLDRAREWISDTLGGLARSGDQAAVLRETVAAYLACGRSFTAAADRLQCHKNTVQYRIRRAEAVCGRPLRERQLDVQVALLACRWLGSAVLTTEAH